MRVAGAALPTASGGAARIVSRDRFVGGSKAVPVEHHSEVAGRVWGHVFGSSGVGADKDLKRTRPSLGMAENTASLTRENQILRDIVDKAIRLRRIGRAADTVQEGLEEMWAANPAMTKSWTPIRMTVEAFETAMRDFDEAVMKAAEIGFDWANDIGVHGPKPLGSPKATTPEVPK